MNKLRLKYICGLVALTLTFFAVFAAEQSGLTRKVQERDTKKDGKIDLRTETYTRERETVLRRTQRKDSDGIWSETRSYFARGKLLVIEEDKDGNGTFESM